MHKKRHISLKDCYKILQVSKSASYEDVKRSYRKKAFELHPDLNPGKPEASSNFQLLNEAYVKLSHFLKSQQGTSHNSKNNKGNNAEPSKEAKQNAHEAYNKEKSRPEHGQQNSQDKEKTQSSKAYKAQDNKAQGSKAQDNKAQGSKAQDNKTQDGKAQAEEKQKSKGQTNNFEQKHTNSSEYSGNKEDVLRDLLNDPFAKRVFQDIYSEINKKNKKNKDFIDVDVDQVAAPIKPPKPKKIKMESGDKKANFDVTCGVGGMVKNWLRCQIDENLNFQFPLAQLRPGARLRFKISRGLSREMVTVEITLPREFIIGKPVRLRGLGKKVGPWQGDLYLTLEPTPPQY